MCVINPTVVWIACVGVVYQELGGAKHSMMILLEARGITPPPHA